MGQPAALRRGKRGAPGPVRSGRVGGWPSAGGAPGSAVCVRGTQVSPEVGRRCPGRRSLWETLAPAAPVSLGKSCSPLGAQRGNGASPAQGALPPLGNRRRGTASLPARSFRLLGAAGLSERHARRAWVQWLLSPGFFGGLAASKPRIENQNRVRRQVLILVLNRR